MKFRIKSGAIKANGRVVRCGNCEYEWVAKPTDSNVVPKPRIFKKSLKFIVPLLLVLALSLMAYSMRNDERFYFLQLHDSPYLVVENINTHFYHAEKNHYAIAKAKVHNISDHEITLDSIMIVLDQNNHQHRSVIDKVGVTILPDKSVIIPVKIENIDCQLAASKAYVGGTNKLRLQKLKSACSK